MNKKDQRKAKGPTASRLKDLKPKGDAGVKGGASNLNLSKTNRSAR